MKKKRFSVEQIVAVLKQAELGVEGPGFSIPITGLVLGLFLFQSYRA